MKEIIIDEKYDGIRFDKYLSKLLCNCSSSFIYKMLRKKNILLNDKVAKGSEKLKDGDRIFIFFKEETYDKFTDKSITKTSDVIDSKFLDIFNQHIIYEDDNLVIVDKWEGIKSQNDIKSDISINTIFVNYLKDKKKDLLYDGSILNRLDTNTKGLMLCAKNYKTSRVLTDAIKTRKIKKYYRFIINGSLKNKSGNVKLYMKKDSLVANISDKALDGYDEIITEYKIIKEFDKYSIVEALLVTGKFHQIRASFSHIGNPLVLDRKYENRELYEDDKKHFEGENQLLISYKIVFDNIDDNEYKYLDNKSFYSKYDIEDYIIDEI